MSATTYNVLALEWKLPGQQDRRFQTLTIATLLMVLLLAALCSVIPVPESPVGTRAEVPDRVAQFVAARPRPPAPVVEPQPLPVPPPPPIEPAPTIQRERPRDVESHPLTEAQKTARERAQNTGLLALHNELSALMDTGDLATMVAGDGGQVVEAPGASVGHDVSTITAQTAQGGRDVSSDRYGSQVGSTSLSAREIAAVRSGLFVHGELEDSLALDAESSADSKGQARSREDVTITFDQNKGALYALYARERRRSPGLEGRIVLSITIAPSGTVTDVKIVSSELNSPSLESGIIGRIKMFRFEAMDVDEITVTYPIEFLPS